MEVHKVQVEAIVVGHRLRDVDGDAVCRLAESIKAIGLQTPITVWASEDGSDVRLIAGAHRLAAAKKLGWEEIECSLSTMDEIDARLWEIAENLHRAELTTLQRSEQIAEWVRLMEQKREKGAQVAQVSHKGGRGNEGGLSAASRELGIDRDKARRALRIAGLTAEAKAAARDAHLDDNQSVLERVARADDQVAEVHRVVEERRSVIPPWERQYSRLMDAWYAASDDARRRFLADIELPEMKTAP